MSILIGIAWETWLVGTQMAPYLLFGFLMAGLLSVVVSADFVESHLGRRGFRQVVKAAMLGVPLPLCSCSVVPVAASLRKHGASPGATLSFLVSTPQTGVDSIMVTQALLGPVFVVFRVVTAFVSGLLSGGLLDRVSGVDDASKGAGDACACCAHGPRKSRLQRVFHYGFVVLAREIGRAMLVGMLISGVLTYLVPDNFFADRLGAGLPAMLMMMVVGIPIYACSSGSVPIAFALMHMGISPGAALVFLVTGPATNAATISTIWRVLGRTASVIYLSSIAACALGAGLLMDAIGVQRADGAMGHAHVAGPGLMDHLLLVVLIAVLAPSLLPHRKSDDSSTEDAASPARE